MRMSRWTLWAVGLALVAGCDGDDDAPVDAGAPLVVGTFNGGLAVGLVDYAEARAPHIVEALAGGGFDVLCVQEFWRAGHRQALYAAVESLPERTDHPADAGACAPACEEMDVAPLQACMAARCPDVTVDMVISCALDNCGAAVDALPGPCLTCISGQVGEKTVDEIVAACGPGAMMAGCYAYDGEFGTALLSRYAVLERDARVLASNVNRRGILYNRLSTPGGPLHVFCTHLTPRFSTLPHPEAASGGTWIQEQADQIAALRAWLDEKVGPGEPVVMLGDFNTGPAVGEGVSARVPENYAALAAGFASVYVEAPGAGCSFCPENPLVGDTAAPVLVDHVLLRGFDGVEARGERVLAEPIEVQVEGAPVETAYSDHYGVKVTIRGR